MNICEREDLIIANLPQLPKAARVSKIQNLAELKASIKERFVTNTNAAKMLYVDYKYLTQTLNGYEIYWSVINALRAHGFTVTMSELHERHNPQLRKQQLKN